MRVPTSECQCSSTSDARIVLVPAVAAVLWAAGVSAGLAAALLLFSVLRTDSAEPAVRSAQTSRAPAGSEPASSSTF